MGLRVYSQGIELVSGYIILITLMILFRHRKEIRDLWAITFFLICVLLYLIIDRVPEGPLKIGMEAGPMILPFSFWVFARSLFNDHKYAKNRVIGLGLVVLGMYYLISYILPLADDSLIQAGAVISRIFSLIFVMMAIYEAQHGKQNDLITKRISLRTLFVFTIGITVVITLMVELGLSRQSQELPRLIQRIFILGLSSYFLVANTKIRQGFFMYPHKKVSKTGSKLIHSIQFEMSHNHLYRQEKFTIGQLAGKLNEKEYRVREAINQEMGYRNFTDFLNEYRIAEAQQMLKNSKDTRQTIMEVAFEVGFNSIGPFNRSFKDVTGFTPTEYKKNLP